MNYGFYRSTIKFCYLIFLSGFAVWTLEILMFPVQKILGSNTLWKGKPILGPRQFANTGGRMIIIELGQIAKDSETRLIYLDIRQNSQRMLLALAEMNKSGLEGRCSKIFSPLLPRLFKGLRNLKRGD